VPPGDAHRLSRGVSCPSRVVRRDPVGFRHDRNIHTPLRHDLMQQVLSGGGVVYIYKYEAVAPH